MDGAASAAEGEHVMAGNPFPPDVAKDMIDHLRAVGSQLLATQNLASALGMPQSVVKRFDEARMVVPEVIRTIEAKTAKNIDG